MRRYKTKLKLSVVISSLTLWTLGSVMVVWGIIDLAKPEALVCTNKSEYLELILCGSICIHIAYLLTWVYQRIVVNL